MTGDSADDPTRSAAPGGEAGGTIGPYRLLQRIGEGGMGEVWVAEQTAPVRRKVALKLIKVGMDTKQVIARFEAERQALALMDHPAIAKVFDAGETPTGRPYFAMEYVQGVPLTEHCDRHRLTTEERLQLFMQVCEGVQHAHHKAIIHRDLKPSNVLVTMQEGKPTPKIIDFGVAKATAQRLTERTMFTELGVLIGTPEYMSPEQADLTAQDIDTRTDVYSLGAMLYQLLVGALPFDSKELRRAGFDEIRRRIREEEPSRPSTRLSTLGGQATTESARRRRVDVKTLRRQLRGDLDWVTMKALEKDRTRRYSSPADLAADIGRHLRHEPVLAGPPRATYRARKFVRRHRFGVAVTAASALVLIALAVVIAVQTRRIATENSRSQQTLTFLTEMFTTMHPANRRGEGEALREVLGRAVERIDEQFRDEPLVRAKLLRTVGGAYRALGYKQEAEPLLERALALHRAHLGAGDPETLGSVRALGALLVDSPTRAAEAERLYREGIEWARRSLGDDDPVTLDLLRALVPAIDAQGRHAEADALEREVLDRRRRVLGSDAPATLFSMNSVAYHAMVAGRNAEAETLYRDVLERRRRIQGANHPDTLNVMGRVAQTVGAQGRHAEAETLLLDLVDRLRRTKGDGNPATLQWTNVLADVIEAQARPAEVEVLRREVLEKRRRVLGENHPDTLWSVDALARVLFDQKRYEEAGELHRDALERRRRILGENHPDTLRSFSSVVHSLYVQGRFPEAEAVALELLAVTRSTSGELHPDVDAVLYNLACLTARQGQRAKAMDWLRQSVEHGFDDAQTMRRDADLDSLRGDPAFEALLARVSSGPKAGMR